MGVGGQHHIPAALPRERTGNNCTGVWVGPRAGLDNVTHTGIRSPDRPTRSNSLYRLSYPDP